MRIPQCRVCYIVKLCVREFAELKFKPIKDDVFTKQIPHVFNL